MRRVKQVVGQVDRAVLGGMLKRFYVNRIVEKRLIRHRSDLFRHGFIGEYIKNDNSLLNVLCDEYGSDKGEVNGDGNPYVWASHNYADIYELMFRLRRNDVELVVECGLGTNNSDLKSSMGVMGKPGASLRVWKDYFPKARIIGIDIDADILFQEDRISTFQCDQTSENSIKRFCKTALLTEASVDIIIDDGLHEFQAGKSLFEAMNKYLANDGIYAIEDVSQADYRLFKDYFAELENKFTVQFFNLQRPNLAVRENRLIVVRHKV